MTVGEKIESLRKDQKLSQDEISKMIGLPQSNYSRMVKKGNDIPVDFIYKVSRVFKISPAFFIIEDYDEVQEQKVLLDEFSQLTLLYWLHGCLSEIFDSYYTEKESITNIKPLRIQTTEQKSELISVLVRNYSNKEFASELSYLLDSILYNLLKHMTIYIYTESLDDHMYSVDLYIEKEDKSRSYRQLTKYHPEL